MPTPTRMLGWPFWMRPLALVFVAVAGVVCYGATQAHPSQTAMAALVAFMMTGAALYLAYAVFATRVWWDREGIGSSHWLGRRRFIRWRDVERGGYRRLVQAFVIEGGGDRVWYSPVQVGWDRLHRYLSFQLRANGVRAWHCIEVHGEGHDIVIDDVTSRAGFYALAWVHDTSPASACERAVFAVAKDLGPLRPSTEATVKASLIVSALEPPDLGIREEGLVRTGLSIYRAE